VPLSVSFKHFSSERGEEIGEVVIFDSEKIDADPVLAANTEEGASGAMVTLIPFRHESPGITELGYKTRREAEAIAKQHGRPALRTLMRPSTMTPQDREITQAVEPDGGLDGHFIEATVRVLDRAGIGARYDFPGCLVFDALGREWATAY
jgi:hypothetical protein